MADNLTTQSATPATVPAASVIATDDVSSVHFQKVKLDVGGDGVSVPASGDATYGLDVDVTRVQGTVTVGDGGSTLSVDDGGGSLTVDGTVGVSGSVAVTGTFYQATQPVSGTVAVTGAYQATQPVSLATAPTTPVTGTFWQATQPVSGTVGVTGVATAANQLPDGHNVVVTSAPTTAVTGTFYPATQNVDVTANTIGLATSAKQDSLLTELELKANLTETQPVSLAVGPAAISNLIKASPTGTTTAGVDTTLFGAVASNYNYITGISVANTSTVTTLISFYEDTYATGVIYRTLAPALGGSNIMFPTPLKLANVNKIFGYRHETTVTGGTVYVSAIGYTGV